MDFVRMKFEQVRQMIGELTASQKFAAFLLAILIAVSLGWMFQAAAKPEQINLFNTPLGPDEQASAEQALLAAGVKVKTVDGLLQVPADEKTRALAVLAAEQIMAPESAGNLQEMALTPSMWRTESDSKRLWAHATELRLTKDIKAIPHVKRASVIVQSGQPQKLGTRQIDATASVTLWMERGKTTTRAMRKAIADMVVPVVPGLKRANISIVDATNRRSFHVPEDEDDNGEHLENIAQWDRYEEDKIRKALSNIPGLIVSVTAVPDPTKNQRIESRTYLKAVSAKLETAKEKTVGPSASAREPGVAANTSVSLPAEESSGGFSESKGTTMVSQFPWVHRITTEGRGGLKELSASVSVPRSFLVSAHKSINGDDAEPGEVDIQDHLERIRKRVLGATNIKDESLVYVDSYPDVPMGPIVETAEAGIVPTLTNHGKPIALGTLAVMALAMVMMFAKRRHADPPSFEAAYTPEGMLDTTVGAVDGGEGALEGIELDEDSIRTQRVVEQVSEMVKERPDSATNLLRRWIEQG